MNQKIDVIVIGKQFQEKSIPLYVMNTQIQPVFRFLTCNEQLALNATVEKYKYQIDTREFPSNLNESQQLQILLSLVENPFIIIYDEKIKICLSNLEKIEKQLNQNDTGSISGIAFSSVIPEVMVPIINSYSKNINIDFIKECQKYSLYTHTSENITVEIEQGNYQLAMFNPKLVKKNIFQFELYEKIEQIIVDSFYRIKECNLKNYIFGGAFSCHEKDNSIYEKRFEKVLKIWTGKYLSYPKPFFASKDSLQPLVRQWKIIEAYNQKIKQKNILFIVPSDVFVNGLNVHVQDLLKKIKDVNIYCLMPSFSNNEIKYFEFAHYFNGVEIERYKIPYVSPTHITVTQAQEYQEMLTILIENYKIDIVHIHIMALGHTLDAPKIAKKLGKKVILSLHDLYYLSGDFTQKDISIPYSGQFLKEKYSIQNAEVFYECWHNAVQEMLTNVDRVVGFSQSTISIYQKWYKIDKYQVIPHGYKYSKKYSLTDTTIENNKIKCVYYGRVEEEKGSNILYDLAKILPDVEFHILGVIADKRFEKENKLPKNVNVYGRYQKEKLPSILAEIKPHFVILPSTWHETFAYTLTEAYLYGLIPIVTPFGALKERVEESRIGFVANEASAESLADVIKKNMEMSNKQWQQLLDSINQVHLTTVEEMIEQYKEIYGLNETKVIEQTQNQYMEQQYIQSQNAKKELYSNQIDQKINNFNYYYDQTFKFAKIENSRGLKTLKKFWDFRNQRKSRN